VDKLVDYLCIIQARVSSSRLPSKIMLDLAGKTLIERVYESVSKSKRINKIIVSTSDEATDDIVELKLKHLNISCFRGDLNNVLKRFYDTAMKYRCKNIIRVTADNPLMDGEVIDKLIELYESKKNVDYSKFQNAIYGLSAEVFSFKALEISYRNSRNSFDREHVTPYIIDKGNLLSVDIEEKYNFPDIRATIDTLDDYIKMQNFYLFCKLKNYPMDINTFVEVENDKNNDN